MYLALFAGIDQTVGLLHELLLLAAAFFLLLLAAFLSEPIYTILLIAYLTSLLFLTVFLRSCK